MCKGAGRSMSKAFSRWKKQKFGWNCFFRLRVRHKREFVCGLKYEPCVSRKWLLSLALLPALTLPDSSAELGWCR